jgi:tetratricopeptide (TPR) repeat protein
MKIFYRAVTIVTIALALGSGDAVSAMGKNPPSPLTDRQSHLGGTSIHQSSKDVELFERGVAKQEEEDYLGAIASYTELLKQNPYHLDAYCNRGFSRAMLGQLKGSLADFNRAIEIAPDRADSYNSRGNVHAIAGNLAASIRDFNRAIALDRNFADAYYNRGISRHGLGDRRGARLDLSRASQLFRMQRDLGGYQQAREWIEKIHPKTK